MISEKFTIKQNSLYRITEKVDENTPNSLKGIGRYKMVVSTIEPARCLYIGDVRTGNYDTGLTESSVDFKGKQSAEIKKILKDREVLVKHYNNKLEAFLRSNPSLSEKDFLASEQAGVNLKHDLIIDTGNLDDYLKLYLAFRGGQITPSSELNNPNYKSSIHIIYDTSAKEKDDVSLAEKRLKVTTWFGNTLEDSEEKAKNYLQYTGVIPFGRNANKSVMFGALETFIKDVTNLNTLLKVTNEVSYEEVLIKNAISTLIKRGKIKKEAGTFYFNSKPVGKSLSQIYAEVQKDENLDLLEQLQNTVSA